MRMSEIISDLVLPVTRGLFEQPAATFYLDPRVTEWILADEANPLNRIARSIEDDSAILDVGAGNGILALLLGQLGCKVQIDAIEPDPVALGCARTLYHSIFAESLEQFLDRADTKRYDCVVMADVVEHIANPEPLLRGLKKLLKPGGKLFLSTPNIAFASVRLALLHGRFDYVDSRILERTHLRFYTRKSLHHLFESTGLGITLEYHCRRNPFSCEINLDDLHIGPFLLYYLNRDCLSRVYQFVFVLTEELSAEPVPEPIELGQGGSSLITLMLKKRTRAIFRKAYLKLRILVSTR